MKIIRNKITSSRRPPRTAPRTKYSCAFDDSPTVILGLTTSGAKGGVSVRTPGKSNKMNKNRVLYYNPFPLQPKAMTAQSTKRLTMNRTARI
jgi:hypothetical protein